MTQYLLSVHMVEGAEAPAPEDMKRMYADVDRVNDEAAINAVHANAANVESTDWQQIVALYDQLRAYAPTPVVELNRAVAVAETGHPAVALAAIDDLDLPGYHLYHAARADLLMRLDRPGEALAAYDEAIALTANAAERELLESRRAAGRVR